MRNDVTLVRGLAVAMISVFLMAGVALATNSQPGSPGVLAPVVIPFLLAVRVPVAIARRDSRADRDARAR